MKLQPQSVGRAVRQWLWVGAVLGIAAGLFDGLRAIGPVQGSPSRAIIALMLSTITCGIAGAVVVSVAAWVSVRREALESDLRPEPLAVGTLHLAALCTGVSLIGFLLFQSAQVVVPGASWRWHVIAAFLVTLAIAAVCLRIVAKLGGRSRWVVSGGVALVASVLLALVGLSSFGEFGSRIERLSEFSPKTDEAPASGDGPNVLLIVLDTTRADHLSIYGYPRKTTPFLEELASSSIIYDKAIAPAPWTVPSHASMFTGQFPSVHAATCEHRVLQPENETLAEILRDNGYETVGFSCNSWVGPAFGLDQGFEYFYEIWKTPGVLNRDPLRRLSSGRILTRILGDLAVKDKGSALVNYLVPDWLDEWQQDPGRRPFFMFINYLEAHLPYVPPEPYRSRFLQEPLRFTVKPLLSDNWLSEIFRNMAVQGSLEAADYAQLADLYDAELAYQDARLRELIEDFERRGLLGETLVIIVGDHGENLGEHGGLLDHCFSIHQTVLHVPLLVRFPPLFDEGVVYDDVVSIVSVFPTILEVSQSKPHSKRLPAVGPLPSGADDPEVSYAISEYDVPVFELSLMASEVPGFDVGSLVVRQRAIQTNTSKVVWRSDGSSQFCDLARDSQELYSVDAGSHPEGISLLRELDRWAAGLDQRVLPPPSKFEGIDEKTRESLKALGYVR